MWISRRPSGRPAGTDELPAERASALPNGCARAEALNGRQVFMIFFPALRVLTGPLPPGALAARFFAAVIRPPLLFLAIGAILVVCVSVRD